MGRATIVSHLGEAKYLVKIKYATKNKAELEQRKIPLNQQYESANLAQIPLDNNITTAKSNLSLAIEDLTNYLKGEIVNDEQVEVLRENIIEKEARLLFAEQQSQKNKTKSAEILAQTTAIQTEINVILEIENRPPVEMWCADYSTELTGEVDTIELDGELDTIVIAPGGVSPILSGRLLQPLSQQSPEQAFFNLAIFPGWQRYKPSYGSAVVRSTIEDTSSLLVRVSARKERPVSSQQGLQIIPDDLSNMVGGSSYMGFRSLCFAAGDRVIGQHPNRDFGLFRVIGFAEKPRKPDVKQLIYFYLVKEDESFNLFSLYCPETDSVILEPTPFESEKALIFRTRRVITESTEFCNATIETFTDPNPSGKTNIFSQNYRPFPYVDFDQAYAVRLLQKVTFNNQYTLGGGVVVGSVCVADNFNYTETNVTGPYGANTKFTITVDWNWNFSNNSVYAIDWDYNFEKVIVRDPAQYDPITATYKKTSELTNWESSFNNTIVFPIISAMMTSKVIYYGSAVDTYAYQETLPLHQAVNGDSYNPPTTSDVDYLFSDTGIKAEVYVGFSPNGNAKSIRLTELQKSQVLSDLLKRTYDKYKEDNGIIGRPIKPSERPLFGSSIYGFIPDPSRPYPYTI